MLASWPHYAEHVMAVWRHLPAEIRGLQFSGHIPAWIPLDEVVMIGGGDDIDRTGGRRAIYVEHGAGQSYRGDRKANGHPAYHGGTHPPHVIGYIAPRQEVADAWGRPAVAAGSPVCDQYTHTTWNEHRAVAITFHWNCYVCPESRSALPHYENDLARIVEHLSDCGWVVLGHHHPRDTRLPKMWRNLGVPIVSVDDVRRSADVLIADNTSLLYEMLYLGREVVALNAPWYRRDIEHGLRFWADAPTVQADNTDELMDRIGHHWPGFTGDARIAERVYGNEVCDGYDGARAATWVTRFVAEL